MADPPFGFGLPDDRDKDPDDPQQPSGAGQTPGAGGPFGALGPLGGAGEDGVRNSPVTRRRGEGPSPRACRGGSPGRRGFSTTSILPPVIFRAVSITSRTLAPPPVPRL